MCRVQQAQCLREGSDNSRAVVATVAQCIELLIMPAVAMPGVSTCVYMCVCVYVCVRMCVCVCVCVRGCRVRADEMRVRHTW